MIEGEDIWDTLCDAFPFEGYLRAPRRPAYELLPSVLAEHTDPGARILDFGAGPCDKTFMFVARGFDVTAFDDLQDAWHLRGNNREKILRFANSHGITYLTPRECQVEGLGEYGPFDVVMLHHVLEHLHDSPRGLLSTLLDILDPGGLLYVTVPNAVNIRKRFRVALGSSNYQPYGSYFWTEGPWRGHIREYTLGDLRLMARYLGLEVLDLRGYNHFLHRVPKGLRWVMQQVSRVFPGWSDSCLLVASKPSGWKSPDPNGALAAQERDRIEFMKDGGTNDAGT